MFVHKLSWTLIFLFESNSNNRPSIAKQKYIYLSELWLHEFTLLDYWRTIIHLRVDNNRETFFDRVLFRIGNGKKRTGVLHSNAHTLFSRHIELFMYIVQLLVFDVISIGKLDDEAKDKKATKNNVTNLSFVFYRFLRKIKCFYETKI